MKHKSILSFFLLLFGLGIATTSCEDMLTPDMDRYNEGFSGRDTVNFYLGILRNVQDMVEQNELLGDLRSDLVSTTSYSSDSIADIINYKRQPDGDNGLLNRAAYYKVINQCNFYLAKVDTNAVKNNIYYMRREYAQVVAIRAWTYLQLVQTYGRVPFITKPVDNANTGWEHSPENWATPDNLVDLLKDDLLKAQVFEHTLGAPQYGTFATGNSSFSVPSSYLRFYTDLVLGDLYLLRGASKMDYEEAAKNYYYFLKEYMESGSGVNYSTASFSRSQSMSSSGKYVYNPNISSWVSRGLSAASLSSGENITVIPSAANSSFGRVLSNTAQIYGFVAHSTNSTSTSTDTEGGESSTTSGQITVTPTWRARQVQPSQSYLSLSAAQSYAAPEFGGANKDELTNVIYYEGQGDARVYATAPMFQLTAEKEKGRFVTKVAPTSNVSNDGTARSASFKYYKSIYRLRQVYLRYAEAINRAGYPRLAFTVLRDGLDFKKMPTLKDSLRYDDVAQEVHTVYYLDSSKVSNAANYVGVDELRRAKMDPNYTLFLDFDNNIWTNAGIHELGSGRSCYLDSIYSYDRVVAQRIEDEAARANEMGSPAVKAAVKRLRSRADEANGDGEGESGDTPDRSNYTVVDAPAPAEADPIEINAVETLIADECALETAFEGTRMFDLIRFARHKDLDQSGVISSGAGYGTSWLAWKIARRDLMLTPYEAPRLYNTELFNILLNPENWYIANPK